MGATPGSNGHGGTLAEGLRTGAAAALAVSGAIAAAGKLQAGDPFAPLNDISHMVLGEERSHRRGFDPTATLLGVGLNVAAMLAWSVLYRALFGRQRLPRSLATAAAATAAIYFFDYHLVPKRFTPGYEATLSREKVWLIFATLGLTLALAGARD